MRWYSVTAAFCRQLLQAHAAPVAHCSPVIVLPAHAETFA